jgi:hypothetical protein
MIFANHNLNLDVFGLLLPDQDAASETNSVSNIKQQTDICVANHGRNPNVVMVSVVPCVIFVDGTKFRSARFRHRGRGHRSPETAEWFMRN